MPAPEASLLRGMALGQIQGQNTRYLIYKELMVSLLNGVMWGGLMGLFAWLICFAARASR